MLWFANVCLDHSLRRMYVTHLYILQGYFIDIETITLIAMMTVKNPEDMGEIESCQSANRVHISWNKLYYKI